MTAETTSPGYAHTCEIGVPDPLHPARTDAEHCTGCAATAGAALCPPPADPVPVIAGTFAIYARPDGGLELVTDVQGRGVETKTIPAAIIKTFTSGRGPLAGMFAKIFGS